MSARSKWDFSSGTKRPRPPLVAGSPCACAVAALPLPVAAAAERLAAPASSVVEYRHVLEAPTHPCSGATLRCDARTPHRWWVHPAGVRATLAEHSGAGIWWYHGALGLGAAARPIPRIVLAQRARRTGICLTPLERRPFRWHTRIGSTASIGNRHPLLAPRYGTCRAWSRSRRKL